MKSDINRSDSEKTNNEKTNNEIFNREKYNTEKSNKVKSNKEKPDEEGTAVGTAAAETFGGEKQGLAEDGSVKAAGTIETEEAGKAAGTTEAEEAGKTDGTTEAEEAGKAAGTTETEEAGKADGTEEAEEAGKTDGTTEAEEAGRSGGREKKSKKGGISLRPRKREAQEEEGEDWENDDSSQDDWEEESEPSKPWVIALVFLGMIFVAAAICVTLWFFTHQDKPKENQNVFAGATTAPGSGDVLSPENQGGNDDSDEINTPEPSSEQNRVTTQDGRIIVFTDCDDMVTPKEYVNLRTEPSTSQGEATVGCRLDNGETVRRTGISEEMGWSRVEYNGQVLYVVTSFVNVVADGQSAE